jgi:hypothetical protein
MTMDKPEKLGFRAGFDAVGPISFAAGDLPEQAPPPEEPLPGARVRIRMAEGGARSLGIEAAWVFIETAGRRISLGLWAPDAARLGALLTAATIGAGPPRPPDDEDDEDFDDEEDYPPLSPDEREQVLRQSIPGTRRMVHEAVAKGCRTPVAHVEVRRRDGDIVGANAGVYDFEKSAYRGNKDGTIHLAHEIDGIEATPAGSYPIILWSTNREDTTVIHAPLESGHVPASN